MTHNMSNLFNNTGHISVPAIGLGRRSNSYSERLIGNCVAYQTAPINDSATFKNHSCWLKPFWLIQHKCDVFMYNQKVHRACNFNCIIESERLSNVTCSHVYCEGSGNKQFRWLEWRSRSYTPIANLHIAFFAQLCSSWQNFSGYSASHSPSQ